MIEPARRPRWVLLGLLSATVSLLEAVSASLVFVLLGMLNDPKGSLSLPLVGDLEVRFPGTDRTTILAWVVAVMAIFFLLRAGAYLFATYVQNRMSYNAGVELADRLLRGYLATPYSLHVRRNSAELVRNAHESSQQFSQVVLVPFVTLASEALLVLALLGVLMVTAPVLTLITVAVLVPVLGLLLRAVQPRLLAQGHLSQKLTVESLGSLQQTLNGFREIRLLGREDWFRARFGLARRGLARTQYLRSLFLDIPRVAIETAMILFILGVVGVNLAGGHDATDMVAVFGLFAYAALRVLPSLNRVMVNVNILRFGIPLVDDLHTDVVAADAFRRPPRSDGPPLPFEQTIHLDDVVLRYDPEVPKEALRGVTLTIRRGESIGIVGPTGGGKSTFVDVLTGLLEPTEGAVLVDGVDIRTAPERWQQHLGMVPQLVFLLDDTLRRNIAFGLADHEIDDDRVQEAVRLARLDEVVAAQPDGLEAVVGEQGVRLSGGQRQRVAIARALYRQPDVLILDEGTSALDGGTEREVIDAIEAFRGQRTIIAIAHRLSTLEGCDRVVHIRDGRIVDEGSWADLVAHGVLRGTAS